MRKMIRVIGVFAVVALAMGAQSAAAMTPREVYQKSGAAVVLILASDDGRTGSGGTGSIISKDGQIVTNAHVITNAEGKPYKTIYVYLKPAKVTGDNAQDLKTRFVAKVRGASPANELDLALLQIENPPADLPTVQFGDPNDVNIGDPVVAVGHPEQGGLWTLTTGTISTVLQNFDRIKGKHVFQTEASFNRGNSGGPLFDENGNMVGINTMIARKAADGLAITAVNFSLKSSVAVDWLKAQSLLTLAYATPPAAAGTAVAQAPAAAQPKPQPETSKPADTTVAQNNTGTPTGPAAGTPVSQTSGAAAQGEAGKPPPANTVPKAAKIETEKRPFNIDSLLKSQMKELDDMMGEMRGKATKKLSGKKGMSL